MTDELKLGLIIGCIGGAVLLIALGVVLYIGVFSKRKYKKQIRDIERKYSYLDALLIGQDSQYIHRLEVISHTNLLYVDKHETFQRRFKEIHENDDKYAEGLIRNLNALVNNNQYKNIKPAISEAKKSVALLEDSVNKLNDDLYSLIKLEESSRKIILNLKEDYRVVKQYYYTNANDLEAISDSVEKVFDKLDSTFAEYETHIESAEYDEAEALVPVIKQVVSAMDRVLKEMPNLCSLAKQVVPDKINELNNLYHDITNKKIPLYHLSIDRHFKKWKDETKEIDEDINDLKIGNAAARCNQIIKEVEEDEVALAKEVESKKLFESESGELYKRVKILDDNFLKVCSLIPEVNSIYVIDGDQNRRIEALKANIDQLWATKRSLDGFLHSETKQPYSVLYEKLSNLNTNYEVANSGLKEFKAYLDSLRISCEEAYNMVSIYYYRVKQIENTIKLMDVPNFTSKYHEQIEHIYDLLNSLDRSLKVKPIDVNNINSVAEELKSEANIFFDDVEDKYRDCMLAESAIVYANRDRAHQNDVDQQLGVLEQNFFNGEFDKVYNEANAIFHRTHVEDNARAKR